MDARIARLRSAFLLLLVVLATALSAQAQRQVLTIEDAKSTLIGAMLDNTTWPNEDDFDAFILGIYRNDEALADALKRDMAAVTVRGKPIRVAQFDTLSEARAAHILMLPRSENRRLAEINQALRHTHTLMVSDGAGDQGDIMVNFTQRSWKLDCVQLARCLPSPGRSESPIGYLVTKKSYTQ